MYILKNAWKNITRSKGRTILIGIIILVIAASSAVTLAINNAAAKAREAGLADLEITATISVDRESVMKSAQTSGTDMREALKGITTLSLDQQKAYADSEFVKSFSYTISTSVDGSGLTAVSVNTDEDSAATGTQSPLPTRSGTEAVMGLQGGFGSQGDFTLVGASSESGITGYEEGTTTLAGGSLFSFEGTTATCLISSELATLNNLTAGDTITLANPNLTTETYSLVISGIYTSTVDENAGEIAFSPSMDSANRIYTSYAILEKLAADSTAGATTAATTTGELGTTALRTQTTGTYSFGNVEDFNSFSEELAAKGLDETYSLVSGDLQAYENSLAPLENISSFATAFLLVVLIIGSIILVVLNIFNIRERKYEVGVLTAIGMKKWKVGLQFVLEIFMVTFIFIIIGTGIGSAASVPVADNLLSSEITQSQEQTTQPEGGMGGGRGFFQSVSDGAYIDQVNATVNLVVLGELVGIGFFLAVVSSVAGVVFIMRYEPLKILSERS